MMRLSVFWRLNLAIATMAVLLPTIAWAYWQIEEGPFQACICHYWRIGAAFVKMCVCSNL
jgi:hypothetical protein